MLRNFYNSRENRNRARIRLSRKEKSVEDTGAPLFVAQSPCCLYAENNWSESRATYQPHQCSWKRRYNGTAWKCGNFCHPTRHPRHSRWTQEWLNLWRYGTKLRRLSAQLIHQTRLSRISTGWTYSGLSKSVLDMGPSLKSGYHARPDFLLLIRQWRRTIATISTSVSFHLPLDFSQFFSMSAYTIQSSQLVWDNLKQPYPAPTADSTTGNFHVTWCRSLY